MKLCQVQLSAARTMAALARQTPAALQAASPAASSQATAVVESPCVACGRVDLAKKWGLCPGCTGAYCGHSCFKAHKQTCAQPAHVRMPKRAAPAAPAGTTPATLPPPVGGAAASALDSDRAAERTHAPLAAGSTTTTAAPPPMKPTWKFTAPREARKLETTLNGVPCTDLICWKFVWGGGDSKGNSGKGGDNKSGEGDVSTNLPCPPESGCRRAHLFSGCCAGELNLVLGGHKSRFCQRRPGTCRKTHAPEAAVLAALLAWHGSPEGRGLADPLVGTARPAQAGRKILGASAATAAKKPGPPGAALASGVAPGDRGAAAACDATPGAGTGARGARPKAAAVGDPSGDISGDPSGDQSGGVRQSAFQLRGQKCLMPASAVTGWLRHYAAKTGSPYLARFLAEPFFGAMMADDRLRQLLCARKTHKELTEAYSVADKVLAAMGTLAARQADARQVEGASPAISAATGEGFVVLDVCSGRGLQAVVLSLMRPLARVVMLDADGGMDLSHVAACPNLSFVPLDLFSADTPAALGALVGPRERGIAFGMHLCGALSPRLATLAVRLPSVAALVLCPCCLKGSLGSFVQAAARLKGPGPEHHYPVLVDTLADLCRSEVAAAAVAAAVAAATTEEATPEVASPGIPTFPTSTVTVEFDRHLLSPKNGFITVMKCEARSPARHSESL